MRRKTIVLSIVIACVGFSFQLALQQWMRPDAIQHLYFQQYSSESLMQTVSIEDLRDAPLESLANLHIQPPALDAIRTLIARMLPPMDNYALVQNVDRVLYFLWALVYGLLGSLLFLWLRKLTNTTYAGIAAFLFMAHPASIFYATLLDATLLSTVLIVWTYYLLWSLQKDPQQSILAVTVAMLALFFTRSIFQWPAILLFAVVLFLLKVPKRKVVIFMLVCGGVAGLYLGKQYYRFGILSTSSFTGLNLSQSIGYKVNYRALLDNGEQDIPSEHSLPNVLVRKKKLLGTTNFNQAGYLMVNQALLMQYKKHLVAASPAELMRSYWQNLTFYFLPSSHYTEHLIVDRIPWRDPYDRLFSYPILPGLLVLGGVVWILNSDRQKRLASMALLLPGLFVFLISVLCEKGENMRFKFFLEPVFFVFIASQLHLLWDQLYQRIRTKRAC